MKRPLFIAIPTLIVMLVCGLLAYQLFRKQAAVSEELRENIASRKIAAELEANLLKTDGYTDLDDPKVVALTEKCKRLVREAKGAANHDREIEIAEQVGMSFDQFLEMLNGAMAADAQGRRSLLEDASSFLKNNLIPKCLDLRIFNAEKIEEASQVQLGIERSLSRGIAFLSAVGGVSGLLGGFLFARIFFERIRQVQVQVHYAAGLIDPAMNQVLVTEQGRYGSVNEQVAQLTDRIAKVLENLQQREREVLRAEQLAAVGQMAAGFAHEIRNPLTSIKLLIQSGQESGFSTEDHEIIESEIRRLEQLLQGFQDFARPPKLSRRAIELRSIVWKVAELVRGRAERQKVRIQVEAPNSGVIVTADGEQIRQVLLNLMLNALDAMPSGGDIHVTLSERPEGVMLQVSDTGDGIAKDVQSRIFEPFFSTKETGLGMGLVISRRIVEDHGGRITFANRPKGGSTFQVFLPESEEPKSSQVGSLR